MVTIVAEKLIFNNAIPKAWPGGGVEEEIEITVHMKISNSFSVDRVIRTLNLAAYESNGSPFAPFLRPQADYIIPAGVIDYELIVTARNMDAMYFDFYKNGYLMQLEVYEVYADESNLKWHVKNFVEIIDNYQAANTGFKGWHTLEEYYVGSGVATGLIKPNEPEDSDYVAPIYDPISCPLP